MNQEYFLLSIHFLQKQPFRYHKETEKLFSSKKCTETNPEDILRDLLITYGLNMAISRVNSNNFI